MPSSSCSRATPPSAGGVTTEHEKLVARCHGVKVLSSLDLEATPPFDYAHDHFGYRDRLSQPVIEGQRRRADTGLRRARSSQESSSSATRMKTVPRPTYRSPKSCRATAASWPIAGCEEHVGAFRDFLQANTARRPRSRSSWRQSSWGAGAAARRSSWRPTRTTRRSAPIRSRNNDFNYKEHGPARLRRAARLPHSPHEPARHGRLHEPAPHDPPRRDLRPALPEGAPDDGVERGIAAFVICASLVRQFEFAQNVWVNDQELPRARQRARPDHRPSGRHARVQDPQAPDPEDHHAVCRPSPRCAAAPISFCRDSKRCAIRYARRDPGARKVTP